MMTRVDVSNVAIIATSEGVPAFEAETVSVSVTKDKRDLMFSLRDPEGRVFAVACVPHERAKVLIRGAGARLR